MKDKIVVCAILGVALTAAVKEKSQRTSKKAEVIYIVCRIQSKDYEINRKSINAIQRDSEQLKLSICKSVFHLNRDPRQQHQHQWLAGCRACAMWN